MNPVVHFEMPYDDAERASKFYQAAFGWQMQNTGAEMGHYLLANTTDTGPDGRPTTVGAINGGMFKRSPNMPSDTSVVVAVQDIAAAMQAVRDAGGEVLGEPMDIPHVGKYMSVRDTEGNRVGMLQPSR